MKRRAVFLDRDGVLNRVNLDSDGRPHPPQSVEDLELIPGVVSACKRLKDAGFVLVIVTNQPDVARGTQTLEMVRKINSTIAELLPIDTVRTCFHDDADACACRKPKPGLLLQAAGAQNVSLCGSFMVGDRWRDVEAGHAAGCTTIQIGNGYGETLESKADFVASDLLDACSWIVAQSQGKRSARGGISD